jgi:hypothetical protein
MLPFVLRAWPLSSVEQAGLTTVSRIVAVIFLRCFLPEPQLRSGLDSRGEAVAVAAEVDPSSMGAVAEVGEPIF